jgi:hypothetical protein
MTPLLVIGVPADFYLTIVHENFEFTSSFWRSLRVSVKDNVLYVHP